MNSNKKLKMIGYFKSNSIFSLKTNQLSLPIKKNISHLLGFILLFSSCIKSASTFDSANTDGISDQLHFSFSTPDWSRFVPCDLLDDFISYPLNDSTSFINASSASTKLIWYFSIPRDSSKMTSTSNLKRYSICDYGTNTSPFQYSQRLPITDGSSTFLGSYKGLSDSSYNEVSKITYISSDSVNALFNIKCRYKMIMYEYGTIFNKKNVTGTFNFKVRALRK